MNRLVNFLFAGLFLSLIFVACGDDGGSSSSSFTSDTNQDTSSQSDMAMGDAEADMESDSTEADSTEGDSTMEDTMADSTQEDSMEDTQDVSDADVEPLPIGSFDAELLNDFSSFNMTLGQTSPLINLRVEVEGEDATVDGFTVSGLDVCETVNLLRENGDIADSQAPENGEVTLSGLDTVVLDGQQLVMSFECLGRNYFDPGDSGIAVSAKLEAVDVQGNDFGEQLAVDMNLMNFNESLLPEADSDDSITRQSFDFNFNQPAVSISLVSDGSPITLTAGDSNVVLMQFEVAGGSNFTVRTAHFKAPAGLLDSARIPSPALDTFDQLVADQQVGEDLILTQSGNPGIDNNGTFSLKGDIASTAGGLSGDVQIFIEGWVVDNNGSSLTRGVITADFSQAITVQ